MEKFQKSHRKKQNNNQDIKIKACTKHKESKDKATMPLRHHQQPVHFAHFHQHFRHVLRCACQKQHCHQHHCCYQHQHCHLYFHLAFPRFYSAPKLLVVGFHPPPHHHHRRHHHLRHLTQGQDDPFLQDLPNIISYIL